MGICALYVFLSVVKRFAIPKALYKFPIIIYHLKSCVLRLFLVRKVYQKTATKTRSHYSNRTGLTIHLSLDQGMLQKIFY